MCVCVCVCVCAWVFIVYVDTHIHALTRTHTQRHTLPRTLRLAPTHAAVLPSKSCPKRRRMVLSETMVLASARSHTLLARAGACGGARPWPRAPPTVGARTQCGPLHSDPSSVAHPGPSTQRTPRRGRKQPARYPARREHGQRQQQRAQRKGRHLARAAPAETGSPSPFAPAPSPPGLACGDRLRIRPLFRGKHQESHLDQSSY